MFTSTNNVCRLLWDFLYPWFYAMFLQLQILPIIFIFRKNEKTNEQGMFPKYTFIDETVESAVRMIR